VCYDLRFPELFRALAGQGAQVIFVPSAFTARTGRDHWEILLRARAIEDQVYIVAPNQWGTHMPGRESYGRSMIVEPWGSVVAQVPDGEGFALAEIDLGRVAQVRAQIPCLQHRRISS
jgi:predicted amidohydrolase